MRWDCNVSFAMYRGAALKMYGVFKTHWEEGPIAPIRRGGRMCGEACGTMIDSHGAQPSRRFVSRRLESGLWLDRSTWNLKRADSATRVACSAHIRSVDTTGPERQNGVALTVWESRKQRECETVDTDDQSGASVLDKVPDVLSAAFRASRFWAVGIRGT
ncbi:hypothetical protein IG631_05583 [Alternaria alternata]|nr:hypothetical protein IG631_05583 [Alternaria alternata]